MSAEGAAAAAAAISVGDAAVAAARMDSVEERLARLEAVLPSLQNETERVQEGLSRQEFTLSEVTAKLGAVVEAVYLESRALRVERRTVNLEVEVDTDRRSLREELLDVLPTIILRDVRPPIDRLLESLKKEGEAMYASLREVADKFNNMRPDFEKVEEDVVYLQKLVEVQLVASAGKCIRLVELPKERRNRVARKLEIQAIDMKQAIDDTKWLRTRPRQALPQIPCMESSNISLWLNTDGDGLDSDGDDPTGTETFMQKMKQTARRMSTTSATWEGTRASLRSSIPIPKRANSAAATSSRRYNMVM